MKQNLLTTFIFLLLSSSIYAQQKDPSWTGALKGIVKDSTINYGLPSATLAIYKDTVLVSYQLSNGAGEFNFINLPYGPLKIVASYIGYRSYSRKFSIDPLLKKIELKPIHLESNPNNLAEVEIQAVAPVRMNGDTLEFNAAAFKMDPNAVTEDLLKKLPGVIVWGDGTITVNGKEIKQFLVNGKPFFGGDTKVATQNIPKDAVDKIQVYRTDFNSEKPLDTVTEVNIKLKKEKAFGYFGKVGAGYGTDKRFDSDLSLNFFSPNTQFGIVGSSNNINKTANNVSTLLRNSTFKGVGANIEYQPNFKANGITRSNLGGFTFQRDFVPDPNNQKNNRLTANYFINNGNNFISNTSRSTTALGGQMTQFSNSNVDSKIRKTDQDFITRYERKLNNIQYAVDAGFKINQQRNRRAQLDSVSSNALGLQSTRSLSSNDETLDKKFKLKAQFNYVKSLERNDNSIDNWSVDYSLNAGNEHQKLTNETNFQSLIKPADSKYFNRFKDRNADVIQQNLHAKLGDFYRLLFGRTFSDISIDLKNDLDFNTEKSHNAIYDRLNNNEDLVFNPVLSNVQQTREIDERPGLNFSKGFTSRLANRFQKSFNIDLNLEGQLYHLNNTSNQIFQTFVRTYQKFIPNAVLSYSHYKDSEFRNAWDLNYLSSYNYPNVDQLYPIVDNSNIYNVLIGNPDLKPSHSHTLSLNFSRNSFKTKNTFNYRLGLSANFINDNQSTSFATDEDGKSTYSFVNLNGYKQLNLTGNLSKSYKLKGNQLQFKLNSSLSLVRTPGLIKDFNQASPILNYSDNLNTNTNLQIYYAYKDILAINAVQSLNTNRSKQTNLANQIFRSSLIVTSIAADTRLTKKMSITSNIDFNTARFTGTPNNNFLIWNANTNYRFMKGNNLELKFSALDILRQNRNIINFANNNIFRQTRVNALQQYFMVSIAYYPRQFGKKDKN